MKDHSSAEDDPFYFSDTIRDIDEEAPFIRLRFFQQLKSPIAILCVDAISGEEFIYAGHVKNIDYELLEIETPGERQVAFKLTNADFYPLRRTDAPPQLQAITTDAYNVGMRFNTGKATYYLLVKFFIVEDKETD